MASSSSSPSSIERQSAASQSINTLRNEVSSHVVAINELKNMSSSRAVYLKNGNIFFRTTMQKATASEEKQLEIAQSKLKRMGA